MAFSEVYVGAQRLPQGLKPHASYVRGAARHPEGTRPCPFKAGHFSCSCEELHFSGVV